MIENKLRLLGMYGAVMIYNADVNKYLTRIKKSISKQNLNYELLIIKNNEFEKKILIYIPSQIRNNNIKISEQLIAYLDMKGMENVVFETPMRRITMDLGVLGSICGSERCVIECRVHEGAYKVNDNYKMMLIPRKQEDLKYYGSETYYISDFCRLLKDGYAKIL